MNALKDGLGLGEKPTGPHRIRPYDMASRLACDSIREREVESGTHEGYYGSKYVAPEMLRAVI